MRESKEATSHDLGVVLFGLVLTTLGVWWFAGMIAALLYAGIYIASNVIAAGVSSSAQPSRKAEHSGGFASLGVVSMLMNAGGLIALWVLSGGKAALIVFGARIAQSFVEDMGKSAD